MVHTFLTKLIVGSIDETLKINNLGKYKNYHLVLKGSFWFFSV